MKKHFKKLNIMIFFALIGGGVQAKESITYASNFALSPFALVGATGPEGFEVDFMNKIAEINDWEISPAKYPFSYFFKSLEDGKADLIVSGMLKTPERAEKYAISTPYAKGVDTVMFTNPNIKINNNEDLHQLKISGTAGSLQVKSLLALGYPEENFVPADSLFLAFKNVMTGKADGVVSYEGVLKNLTKSRKGNFYYYKIQGIPEREIIAIAPKGKEAIMEQFNVALKQLKASGGR